MQKQEQEQKKEENEEEVYMNDDKEIKRVITLDYCSHCGSRRIFELGLGFKVARSEFSIKFAGRMANEGSFPLMYSHSPFQGKKLGTDDDATIAACFDCGRLIGTWPAPDLLPEPTPLS